MTFDPPENVGGVEGRITGYVEDLSRRGIFVEVQSFAPKHSGSIEAFHGTIIHKESSKSVSLPGTLWRCILLLRNDNIDRLFFVSGALTIFGSTMLAYCKLTRRHTAVLYYGKDILQARKSYLGRLLLAASMRLADRVVTNSKYTSSLIPRSVIRKSSVLYPSVAPSMSFSNRNPSKQVRRKTILFVGRLVKRKGVADLIEAVRLLEGDLPETVLEIVGDGPEKKELERLVADLGLAAKVTFYGTLRGDQLNERYANCDVLVMPSRTIEDDVEGFGTVFLEAGLFGKPSIGTDSGGIPEAVLDGITGIIVEEGDVQQLALGLRKILTDQNLAATFGEKAKERVLAEFTWEAGTNRLIEILKDDNYTRHT